MALQALRGRSGMRLAKAGVRDTRAQSLVEFALASFVFFLTLFGTIELGLAIWQYNMVSDLAQEGARWASVRGASSGTPASANAVRDFVLTRAPFTVTVTTTPAPSTIGAGATVTVQVQTTFTRFTAFIPHATLNLTSTAKMIMQR